MMFILIVLETGKSKIKVLEESLSGERPLPGLQMAIFLYPHMALSGKTGRAGVSPLARVLILL